MGVLWELHVASRRPCVPGGCRVAWSRHCACGSDTLLCQERGQQCPGMSLQPGTRDGWCHSPHREVVEVGAGVEMGQGACAEAPAPQGRGAAVPAVAAARASATGGGRRAGICWIYGPSHDVFMVGLGQPQMLPSPALHGRSPLCILVQTGWRFSGGLCSSRWSSPGLSLAPLPCLPIAGKLDSSFPVRSTGSDPAGIPGRGRVLSCPALALL